MPQTIDGLLVVHWTWCKVPAWNGRFMSSEGLGGSEIRKIWSVNCVFDYWPIQGSLTVLNRQKNLTSVRVTRDLWTSCLKYGVDKNQPWWATSFRCFCDISVPGIQILQLLSFGFKQHLRTSSIYVLRCLTTSSAGSRSSGGFLDAVSGSGWPRMVIWKKILFFFKNFICFNLILCSSFVKFCLVT